MSFDAVDACKNSKNNIHNIVRAIFINILCGISTGSLAHIATLSLLSFYLKFRQIRRPIQTLLIEHNSNKEDEEQVN